MTTKPAKIARRFARIRPAKDGGDELRVLVDGTVTFVDGVVVDGWTVEDVEELAARGPRARGGDGGPTFREIVRRRPATKKKSTPPRGSG